MNVYNKITDYLGEAKLPAGSKKINSRMVYITDYPMKGNVSVWEKSKKGEWSEWWVMTPQQFKQEFGK